MATDRSDKVDVLFVVPAISYEGISKVVLLQIRGLLKEEYRVKLLSLTTVNAEVMQTLAPWLAAADVEELRQPEPYLSIKSLRSSFVAALRVSKLLARYQPAVVFAHAPYSHFILRLALMLGKNKKSISLWQYFHFPQYEEFPLNSFRRKFINLLNKWLAKRYDTGHISVSRSVKDDIAKHLLNLKSHHIIYNAIPEVLAESKTIQRGMEYTIVVPGRLEAIKGQLWFLDAFKVYLDQLNNNNIKLIFAGGGSKFLDIIDKIGRLGLNELVSVTGSITNTELQDYVQSSDLVVVPSLLEGFGLVVLEALMCGKVVLSADAGGLKEVVVEGTGFLFKAGDVDDCITKLLYIYEHRSEPLVDYNKIAEHLYTRFSFEKHMQDLKAIVERG